MRKIEDNLAGTIRVKETSPYKKKPFPASCPSATQQQTIDIAAVSAIGFHYNLRVPENKAFTTSLYEIDRLLEDRQEANNTPEEDFVEALRKVLPPEYWPYQDVFSQSESDKLPPHRPYDHKIELEGENTLGFSPLYHMTTEELETVKQYLVDNLSKGFIKPSQAPFAAPVLFVKKANSSLRFYIDF
jgi:hypothetical protein